MQSELDFCFESYGVKVRVESDSPQLLEAARSTAVKALLGRLRFIDNSTVDHTIFVGNDKAGAHFLINNGNPPSTLASFDGLLSYFNAILRVSVAEKTKQRVFIHAGVVGWQGKAIVLPATSQKGKTTLVAELVRCGAEYLSDEFAEIDPDGRVFPFARDLSVRVGKGTFPVATSVESFGGRAAIEPMPVGMVSITEYSRGAIWKPEQITLGQGIIETIPNVIPIRLNTKFSMKVLNIAFSRAIIIKSSRGEAAETAKLILSYLAMV